MLNFIMRGYQLKRPDIEQDGLILYYDFKGKKNYDKNRDIALNMSNARDWGHIRNVSYTVNSGFNANNGLEFDGVDDYIRLDLGSKPQNALTIDISMRLDKTRSNQSIIKCGVNPYLWWIRYHNNKLEFIIDDLVHTYIDVSDKFDSLTHLTIVIESDNISLWINGIREVGIGFATNPLYIQDTPIYIGMSYPNRQYLRGRIATLRVYNKKLEESQLTKNRTIDQNRWGNI